MLHALELENFKAFGKRARIPFAPITLIFGENSAGKSTILQALYLLKQTRESREADVPLLLRGGSEIVDLGGFQEIIFDHDLEQTFSIRVETKVGRGLSIESSFRWSPVKEAILLDQIKIYDGKPSKCFARFQTLGTTVSLDEFRLRRAYFHNSPSLPLSKLIVVKCVWLTKAEEHWKSEFERCKKNRDETLNRIKNERLHLTELLKHQTDMEDSNEQEHFNQKEFEDRKRIIQERVNSLSEDIKFFSSDFNLKTYISKGYKKRINTVLGVQGFLPVEEIIPSRRNFWMAGTHSLLHGQTDDIGFDIAQLALAAGKALGQTLETLFPIRPFRQPPERWYIFRGTSPQHVGYQGDLLPDLLLRRPELVDETNEWLEKLNIGHKLTVKSMGADSGDLFEVRLIDTRRKEPVSVALPDVGFGVSQLLPFIVQSLVSEGQIISIEQPEVHVHPKLQADLGDLLAEAIKEPRSNRFIVETHSEHLILRLQRLVYEKRIKPEDVSVIYVSRGYEGAKAERLHLDEEGDFIDEWPNGFFLERLRELR